MRLGSTGSLTPAPPPAPPPLMALHCAQGNCDGGSVPAAQTPLDEQRSADSSLTQSPAWRLPFLALPPGVWRASGSSPP